MTEPIAVNSFILTKELFYEGSKRTSKENYSAFARRMVMIMIAAWLGVSAVTILTHSNPMFIAMEALVLILAALWVADYTPRHKRRKAYNAFLLQYGENAERTVEFYADRLTVDPDGCGFTVPYSAIAKTLTTENLLIVITSENKGVLVKRGAFTKGSEAKFLELVSK